MGRYSEFCNSHHRFVKLILLMSDAPCYLLYLAYGSEALHAEALYSLLSYYQIAKQPVQVLIYTDAPAAFQRVLGTRPGIEYPEVSPTQWQEWRGTSNKVYLLKIGVMGHAAQHYPGNLLFVDTDTIWQADPEPLFQQIQQGQYVMHVNEGRLATGNMLSRKVYKHLKGRTFSVGTHHYVIEANTMLYNSGVIGLSSTVAGQLAEVATLADQLYATYNKHMMEQLAFSLWFETARPVIEAAPYVVHYWNLKTVRPLLAQLLNEHSGPSLGNFYERVNELEIKQLHQSEMNYRNLPSWRRTLLKLIGRRWQLPNAMVSNK